MAIKARAKKCKKFSIIVVAEGAMPLTAYVDQKDVKIALESGLVKHCLSKPFYLSVGIRKLKR